MGESTTIIAFDQHAASVMAAVLLPGHQTAATQELSSDVAAIGRFVKRVQRQGPVRCCYEAGPCGFELQRYLQAKDVPCAIIAPTLIPRRPGDRIKTDRRDARQLAVLYRAGALTAIHIPTEQEEAACGRRSRRTVAVGRSGSARAAGPRALAGSGEAAPVLPGH